jgi:phytanoyl-CoA hydroxylase
VKPVYTCEPPVELWIDRDDAPSVISCRVSSGELTPEEAGHLLAFRDKGYTVMERAIEHADIDQLLDEVARLYLEGEKYVLKMGKGLVGHPEGPVVPRKGRLYDLYVNNMSVRAMVLAAPIIRILSLIYEQPPLVFQSMLFTWGSEQSIHKDTAFVVIDQPCTLAATWIALEDIQPGSGELMYYPGSHRDPLFLFSEEHLAWVPGRDGKGVHARYSEFLHQQAVQKTADIEYFRARKGDVLIWHPNLAHGGAPITNDNLTRMSLVSHYCPASNNPNYFRFFDRACKQAWGDGFFSSRRYDLRPDVNNPLPVYLG